MEIPTLIDWCRGRVQTLGVADSDKRLPRAETLRGHETGTEADA